MSWGDNTGDVRELVMQRADVLAVLTEGVYDKQELTSELGVSRSTVDRAIRELETEELTTWNDGRATATLAGRLAYDSYQQFCEETKSVVDARELLCHLDADVSIDADVIIGGDVYRAQQPAPCQPSEQVMQLVTGADSVQACSFALTRSSAANAISQTVLDHGATYECIYDAEVATYLREERFHERREMAATGRYRTYESDQIDFGLFCTERDDELTVALCVYDDNRNLRGVIVNDTDPAVDWATETFERLKTDATEFTDDFLSVT